MPTENHAKVRVLLKQGKAAFPPTGLPVGFPAEIFMN